MNVTVEEKGPCRKLLRVEVPAEEVSTIFEDTLNTFTRHARIDGFRPGKAPREMVRRRYAKAINDEIQEYLVAKCYQDARKETKLNPLAILHISDAVVQVGEPFAIEYTVDVPPVFQLPTYDKIKVTGKPIEVTAADVDKGVKDFCDYYSKFNDIKDRPVQRADLVMVDFKATVDGKPLAEAAPNSKNLAEGKDFWVLADEGSFFKGFGEALLGMQLQETRKFTLATDDQIADDALKNRAIEFEVTAKGIREKTPPVLDEAFFKSAGATSMENLREMIAAELKRGQEEKQRESQMNEIINYLLSQVTMELPDSIVQEETQRKVYDMVLANSRRGISSEDIQEHKEAIFNAAAQSAAGSVKLSYILHRIADAEKLEVTEAEVTQAIRRDAARQGQSEKDFLKRLKDKADTYRQQIQEHLRESKTLHMLLTRAEVTAAAPTTP